MHESVNRNVRKPCVSLTHFVIIFVPWRGRSRIPVRQCFHCFKPIVCFVFWQIATRPKVRTLVGNALTNTSRTVVRKPGIIVARPFRFVASGWRRAFGQLTLQVVITAGVIGRRTSINSRKNGVRKVVPLSVKLATYTLNPSLEIYAWGIRHVRDLVWGELTRRFPYYSAPVIDWTLWWCQLISYPCWLRLVLFSATCGDREFGILFFGFHFL